MRTPPNFRVLAVAALFIILCGCQVAPSVGDEGDGEGDGDGEAEAVPNFAKMRVKELRGLLEERGVECRGCAEKADLVARVKETYHLPRQPKTEWKEPAAGGQAEDKLNMDDPEVQELIKNLQKQMKGKGDFKMFNGKDFANMAPEDIERKVKGEL